VCDACFPKHFLAPNNVVKYDGKTNPIIWLEYYRLECRAGGADNASSSSGFSPFT
jgi:hypothetical protein